MNLECIASRLEISGVVQGVGFRPFLFALAQKYKINGEVANTSGGVLARVEGPSCNLDEFVHGITANPPVLARVDKIDVIRIPVTGFTDFHIIPSRASKSRATLISPDVCVCDDCLEEMRDPENRRFAYPFINCTNCGPRFTIISDIPYDRPSTSMKDFVMCPDCRAEYENPTDRRFHAQPNACPVCGPHVFLTDNQGRQTAGPDNAAAMAGALLKKGHILAIKGLGGFHLAADAANDQAVRMLRQRKYRPHKPFALMARSADVLHDHVQLSDDEKNLLHCYHRPIVLANVLAKKDLQQGCGALSPALAPDNTCLGIMLPYTPLHYLVFDTGPDILVMTSGNRSGEPLSVDNQDALDAFSHIADYFLLHNRDIYFRADDSIIRIQAQKPRFIRRSRGYAPLPVQLNRSLLPVLGCGAGLKNTICLTRGNQAFLSQHIGDMENQKTYEFFTHTIAHFTKILDTTPKIVAHDLHPGYMSTKFAGEYAADRKQMADRSGDTTVSEIAAQTRIPLVGVQHHHAHAVSCMAENNLDEPVIAITLDGTGYGTDGHIWGGEILAATCEAFQRKAHLGYVPMPGGDAAVLEPWRMAAAVLYTAMGSSFLDLDMPYIRQMDRKKLVFISRMIKKQINCPKTSSCGRLFDAVASMLCIRHTISHESQAATALETEAQKLTGDKSANPYAFRLDRVMSNADGPEYIIDMMPCIRDIVADIAGQVPAPVISRRFHQTIVAAFALAAEKIAGSAGLDKVVLSGGVFHNDIILTEMIRALEEKGRAVFSHSLVPTGDGGISLGQVVAAGAMMYQSQCRPCSAGHSTK